MRGGQTSRAAPARQGTRAVDSISVMAKCFAYEMSPAGNGPPPSDGATAHAPTLSREVKAEVDEILEAVIYLYTESRRITKELARRAELTGPQLTVVKMLETVGDLSLSDLSDRIRAQNSTVTGIIDRMEREGLVTRARSTEDRRVVKIRLTEKGERIAREIPVEPMEIFRSALSSMSGPEMRELLRLLTKLAKRVHQIVRRDVGDDTTGRE
jgi:DNA-binding MarR family transcriptional regulator